MLTRLTAPTSGAVWFAGSDASRDPVGFRRRFRYVPEEPQLYPFLSGREYLELVGRLRDMPAALLDWRIPALLELFSMSGAAEQPIAGYSKGMKQRVLIIAALIHDPDLLHLRRARFRARRRNRPGLAAPDPQPRRAREGDPLQLARARIGRDRLPE